MLRRRISHRLPNEKQSGRDIKESHKRNEIKCILGCSIDKSIRKVLGLKQSGDIATSIIEYIVDQNGDAHKTITKKSK